MDQGTTQDVLKSMESTNKYLSRIADALSVFKVMSIAFFIAFLIFVIGNYLK